MGKMNTAGEMSCKRHPESGIVSLGDIDVCYGCYCEQFEYCPLSYTDRTKEEDKPMRRFWECYVEGTDGGKHFKHRTLESAQGEAERLARLPDVEGRVVYLFECVGVCSMKLLPVKWDVPKR